MLISLFPEIMTFKANNYNNWLLKTQFWSLDLHLVVLSYFNLVWLFSLSAKFTTQLKCLNKNILVFLTFSKTLRHVLKSV